MSHLEQNWHMWQFTNIQFFPSTKKRWIRYIKSCEGVICWNSGNKETLVLVNNSKVSSNRDLFLFFAAGIVYWKSTHYVVVAKSGFSNSAEAIANSKNVILTSDKEFNDLENLVLWNAYFSH